jgi:hypothetical protein
VIDTHMSPTAQHATGSGSAQVSPRAEYLLADVFGYDQGWWWYPIEGGRSVGRLEWYAGAAVGVAGLTLIRWRVYRRFGLWGLTIFFIGLSALATTRDWGVG